MESLITFCGRYEHYSLFKVFALQGKQEDLCIVATQAEQALGEVDIVLLSSSPSPSHRHCRHHHQRQCHRHRHHQHFCIKNFIIMMMIIISITSITTINNDTTTIKMVGTVEDLMIGVLGGSAEIVNF